MRNEPLVLTLELLRKNSAADPFAFQFQEQEYLRRRPDGTVRSALFPWSQGLLDELTHVDQAEHVGNLLRDFLDRLDWGRDEVALRQAQEQGRDIHFVVRASAAEMYALPWELLTLRDSGLHVGQLKGCTVRYEWPGEPPRRVVRPISEGRILFAWSAAGGFVPASAHLRTLREVFQRGDSFFNEKQDVLEHVSVSSLEKALLRAPAVDVLHLLCHGRQRGNVYGLVWDGTRSGQDEDFVDSGRLRELLAPYAGSMRMVVLCACQGGTELPGSHMGSVAQALHRVGIPAVVASRLKLSSEGSIMLTGMLYGGLLGVPESPGAPLDVPSALDTALNEARKRLRKLGFADWASLQLYARADAGPDLRPLPIRPYRGLLAFEPEHRRFFFGRKELEQELLARVQAGMEGSGSRFQVVAGASGSGKSSLVLAGLVPLLREDAHAAWEVRVMQPSEAGAWRTPAEVEGPGRFSSLGRLRGLLYDLHRQGEAPGTGAATGEEVLEEARRLRKSQPQQWLLLVVDQFEEVFTQVPTVQEREVFVRTLWRLAHTVELRAMVVATLRVDAFERCGDVRVDEQGRRLDTVVYSDAHRLFVSQVQAEQLAEVIEKPARVVGLEFEPGLVELLRRDVEQEPGALPLLEHALDQLWERREGSRLTQAAYEAIGGVAGAIARTGDQLYEELPEAERHQARWLLVRLVYLRDETSPHTRRREWLRRVRPEQEDSAAAFDSVVEKLVQRRLVVKGAERGTEGQPSEIWLQIAHEALIRRWDKLVGWVQEDRERELRVREMDAWARDWEAHRSAPDAGYSYLLSGSRLVYALEVGEKYSQVLPQAARDFLTHSQETEERRKREEEEKRRSGLDISRVLQARRLLERDPTLAALVLREVTDPERTSEWHQTTIEVLRRPLSTAIFKSTLGISTDGTRTLTASGDGVARVWFTNGFGEPVMLEGEARSAAFSPDGRRVVTIAEDGKARLWKTDGSGESVVLQSGRVGGNFAGFSPDGRQVGIVSNDGAVWIWKADGSGKPVVLKMREFGMDSMVFSPDGLSVMTVVLMGPVTVWKSDGTGIPVVRHSPKDGARSAAFSPDSLRVVTVTQEGAAWVWRVDGAGNPVKLNRSEETVGSAIFSPNSRYIVTTPFNGDVLVWRANGAGKPVVLEGHEAAVSSAAFSPDGRYVVTASFDRTVRVWRVDGSEDPAILRGQPGEVKIAAFSPDGARVITTASDGTVWMWKMDGSGAPAVFHGHQAEVKFATFSPDERSVITASKDGSVRSWWASGTGKPVVFPGREGGISSAVFNSKGTHLFAVSADGTARVRKLDGTGGAAVLYGQEGVVTSIAINPDGTYVATVSSDGTVRVWRSDGDGKPVVLEDDELDVISVEVSPDGKHVVVTSMEGWVKVWSVGKSGKPAVLEIGDEVLSSAVFSPDGKHVVTTSMEGRVEVWRKDGSDKPVVLRLHERGVRYTVFSPDSGYILLVWYDDSVSVQRVEGRGESVTFEGHGDWVNSAAFSPDGTHLVTASMDGTARVWRVDGRGEPVVLEGNQGEVTSAAFSPDGSHLVTASKDGTARVWKADGTGEPIVLDGHLMEVDLVAFSPDGARVFTKTEDGTIRIWTIGTAQLQAQLREATNTCLTPEQRRRYLFETPEEAQAGYERCEREQGRTPFLTRT